MRCSFAATDSLIGSPTPSGATAAVIPGVPAPSTTAGAGSGGAAGPGRKTTLFFSIFASIRRAISRSAIRCSISASGCGGSAPKYRSSAARSRKYSAIAFIVVKGSSNPSSVHEKVP